MSAEAREAVARAVYTNAVRDFFPNVTPWDRLPEGVRASWYPRVDVTLAALQPIIAAEIRAWASEQRDALPISLQSTASGWAILNKLAGDVTNESDTIASRICGGDR